MDDSRLATLIEEAKFVEANPGQPNERIIQLMTGLSILAAGYRLEAARVYKKVQSTNVKDPYYKIYRYNADIADALDGQHGLISVLKYNVNKSGEKFGD